MPFLRGILLDLCRAGLPHSRRGADGGHGLVRAAAGVTVGDVLRAANGSLTTVRGRPADVAVGHGVAVGAPRDRGRRRRGDPADLLESRVRH